MKSTVFVVIVALLTACAPSFYKDPDCVGTETRPFNPISESPTSYELTEDFTFTEIRGNGILGDAEYTLPKGIYVSVGNDASGTYYLHEGSAVFRKENMGIQEEGVFYLGNSENIRSGFWLVPKDNDVYVGIFGPAGVGMPVPVKDLNAVYYAHIPKSSLAAFE